MQTEYESAYCGGGLGRTLPDSAAFGSWVAPAQSRLNQGGDGVRVSGPSRHRYFKRPVLPFLSEQPPEVLLAPLGAAEPPPPSPEPAAREMATQSDYRESEAQTDPFSPEYSLPPGEAPELLALAGLTHVNGQLPATLQTVEAIERARAKRQFEAALPPLTDEASLSLRRKMLSEQETREWAVREAEMREAREAGVAQFDASMRSDAARLEAAWEERVEQLRQLRLTQKDREIAGIQRGRIKALRKLSEARKHAAARVRSKEPRDIVGEYADYGSQVYAPLDRKGLSLTQDKLADRFETRAPQLEDYNGLCELEASLPSSAFEVRVSKPKPAAVVGPAMRAEQRLRNTLDATAEALQRVKHAPDVEREEREAVLALYRDAKPVERPPTPEPLADESEAEDGAAAEAALLLQRLLRGRAVQNLMYAAKERRLELLAELRSEEGSATDPPSLAPDADEVAREAVFESAVGAAVGDALDAMAKELGAQREERRIAALAAAAEEERQRRETAETRRRTAELEARRAEEEAYRQVMAVHRGSARSFVAALVDEVAGEAAAAAEGDAARARDGELGALLDRLESKASGAGEVACALLRDFVIPDADRLLAARQADAEDRKFARAAQLCIGVAVESAEAALCGGV
uniref:Cilia- and flagella-associated protein 91 n=1 Tax=Emiliania huxleyi TaxID=2903 RepID=A0A7S3S6L9_EMIHU|mmetsp:Transcript_30307/g.90043  ORF Transcript_30307/g.90043 Transcript_30307/m.90043 type:complete len:638 (-) Transcript_30307:78-1991(-)